MRGEPGFFDVEERLKELSAKGDDLERLNAIVDFEMFRADLERAVPRSERSKGGRPPYDHVLMFRVLILQSSHSLSDERTEYLIKDRLSFMRFLRLSLAQSVPDANSIWNFREALTRAKIDGKPAIEVLFTRFDAALTKAGFLAMGGQIIDATIVAAPKQRNTEAEKKDIKEGRIPEDWKRKPAKLRQKDRDARWTVKYSKAKPSEDGAKRPAFGYKNHIGIDRVHGLIRTWAATDASRHDGAQLPNLVDKTNTASDVWADTAYRSAKNEKHLAENGLRSQIHRKKPQGKPMPEAVARANGKKSKVRAYVEHVFAQQKGTMVLVIRTIGLARATVKIGLANLTYNMKRAVWLSARTKPNDRSTPRNAVLAALIGCDPGPSRPHDLQTPSSRRKTQYLEVSDCRTGSRP